MAGRRVRVLDRLADIYGEYFLSYVLNCSETAVEEIVAGVTGPNDQQRSVLRKLERVARDSVRSVGEHWAYSTLYRRITRWVPRAETTWVCTLRLQCGGELPSYEHDNPLEEAFLTFARDVFPVLIAREVAREKSISLTWSLAADHPARAVFTTRAAHHELSQIVSSEGRPRTVLWSTGHRAEYPAPDMLDCLFAATVEWLQHRQWHLTWPNFVKAALFTLEQARAANDGRKCRGTIIAGISDVYVSASPSTSTYLLNANSPQETYVMLSSPTKGLFPPSLDPSPILQRGVTAQIFWDEDITWRPDEEPVPQPQLEQAMGRRQRQQLLDLARIGIAQVEANWAPKIPVLISQRLLVPFGPRGVNEIHPTERVDLFTESPGRRAGHSHERWLVVREREAAQITALTSLLLDHGATPSMVAASRRLAAAGGQSDVPSDRLLDLVIAFEAMFGGSLPGEKSRGLTEKLVSALAKVPSRGDEASVDLPALFDLRGRVVHGGGRALEYDSAAIELKIEAVLPSALRLAYDALLAIVSEPYLYEATSSAERRALILKQAEARKTQDADAQ